jgi:site-specific DNA recombinase
VAHAVPEYGGMLVSLKNGERAKGLHQPLITEELFEHAQRRGKPSQLKRKINPALPLKNFVRCAACGIKLTGGFAKSKTGAHHGYYWCRNKACRAMKSIRIEVMPASFMAQLQRLRPSEDALLEFPRLASKIWNEMNGDSETRRAKLNAKLAEVKKQRSSLLKMRVSGELTAEEFAEANAEYSQQIADLEHELHTMQDVEGQREALMRFLELRLTDIAGAWVTVSSNWRPK